MAESFNPYREWLGLDATATPPNHYELLELPPGESDLTKISAAADRAMARVRRVRPGAHAGEWGRLLDRIEAVKVCLLDPAAKAAYDQELGDGGAATDVPSLPPEDAPPRARPWDRVGNDLGGDVPRPASASAGPMPAGSTDPPDSPPTPADMPDMPDSEPRRPPWERVAARAVGGSTLPAGATPPEPTFSGVAPPDSFPIPPSESIPPDAPPLAASGHSGDRLTRGIGGGRQRGQGGMSKGLILVGATGLAIVGLASLVAAVMLTSGFDGDTTIAQSDSPRPSEIRAPIEPPESSSSANQSPTEPSQPDAPDARPSTRKNEPPESLWAENSGPVRPRITPDGNPNANNPSSTAGAVGGADAGVSPSPSDGGPPAPRQWIVDVPSASATDPAGGGAVGAGGHEPGREPQPAPSSAPTPTRAQAAEFAEAMAAARAAVSARRMDEAREHLARARQVALRPADQKAVARLELVIGYLDLFWWNWRQTVEELPVGYELIVDQHLMAVVEASSESLKLRSQGITRDFPLDDAPRWLVTAVADKLLAETPEQKLALGVFLAFDGRGRPDIARAQNLWDQADRAGLETDLLRQELSAISDARNR